MVSRAQLLASAAPINIWPSVDASCLDERHREIFEARRKAMVMYFDNVLVSTIERITGVNRVSLHMYATKCLAYAPDGRILGFRALIPYIRCRPHKRRANEKPKRPEQQGGHTGLLNLLFARFPQIEEELKRIILQQRKRHAANPQKLRIKDIHKYFLDFIKEQGVARDEWPFTAKHLGIKSIGSFATNLLNRNFSESIRKWGDEPARAHLATGTGNVPFLHFAEPFDAVEIDSYHIDAHLTVSFKTPEGDETELLLQRLWLIAIVEVLSSAVLAYEIVYRSEVTADDILRVIRKATTTMWEPKKLTISKMSYGFNAGLPSGLIPATYAAQWNVILFDNALAHLANSVRERARQTLGFVINWGPVRRFERRPNVEHTFKQIATDVFHRLPSTTGSSPFKGRAQNAEDKAIRWGIRAEHAEEYIDVYFANHNATPSEGQYSRSPLEVLKYYLAGSIPLTMPRKLPETVFEAAKTLACRQNAVVRGGRATGRRPYIQIDRVRYTSPILAEASELIGQTLIINIDEEDMRQVKAFLRNGQELGFLTAHGKWSVTKHDRRTRREINSLLNRRILILSEFDDPVISYLAQLSVSNGSKGKKKQLLAPKQVTKVAHVARDGDVALQLTHPPEAPRTKSIGDLVSRQTVLILPMPEVKIRNRR